MTSDDSSRRLPEPGTCIDPVSGSSLRSVLLVDDEPGILRFLQRGLSKQFGLIEVATDVARAEALRQRCHFDLIIADIRLPGRSGVEWVQSLREQGSDTTVIFITAYADLETALAALRAGAADLIMKPFRMEQVLASVQRALEGRRMRRENFVLKRQLAREYDDAGMLGQSEAMLTVCKLIRRIAPTISTVLLEGESGTGKELAARAIHGWSGRSGCFVPVNCGAMTAELLESELFGHVKGAHAGAHQAHEGLVAYANEGTLFLDEIADMPPSLQMHLLRVLEDRQIRPVGANNLVPVDVRVIAATNRDLEAEVEAGRFRCDLFYRLNVVSVRMPPLRDRCGDVVLLANHFMLQLARELGLAAKMLSDDEARRLMAYGWPGNVRELKNVIERSLLLDALPSQCMTGFTGDSSAAARQALENMAPASLHALEKQHILRVLDQEGGNKSSAAKILGISRKTLERKTKAWELEG